MGRNKLVKNIIPYTGCIWTSFKEVRGVTVLWEEFPTPSGRCSQKLKNAAEMWICCTGAQLQQLGNHRPIIAQWLSWRAPGRFLPGSSWIKRVTHHALLVSLRSQPHIPNCNINIDDKLAKWSMSSSPSASSVSTVRYLSMAAVFTHQ